LKQVELVGGALQLLAKLRGGNRDQVPGALGEVTPMQLGDAVLGDDIVDVRPRGGDSCTRGEHGDNARDQPVNRFEHAICRGRLLVVWRANGRRQGDDGSPTLGEGCAALEVRQPGFRDTPSLGDPATTSKATLALVEAATPPLRLFLGTEPLGLARATYEQRLKTWEQWDDVSRAAQGT
jgi:hypothetical protein